MPLVVTNNVKKIIAVPVAASDTTITLADTIGLPNVDDPADYTILTLIRLSDLQQEIVQVDEIVGNVLTVQRAQEGTIALSFVGNDQARNFFTAGMFEEIQQGSLPPPPASETVAGVAELATQAEADAGVDDERIITPLKLKGVVDAQVVTPDATETVKGKAELATQAETDGGTDDERIVTPLKLATYTAGLGIGNQSIAIYKEIQPAGTDGGSTASGAALRLMNTEVYDPDNLGTLDMVSGKVTLVAGTYLVEGNTVAYNPDGATVTLVDSATGDIANGRTAYASSGNTAALDVTAVVVADGVNDYIMRIDVNNGIAGTGRGRALNKGLPECYATLKFTKIG